jgi:CheY-like chemotaxis protein
VKEVCSVLLADDDENDILFFKRAWQEAGVEHPLHIVVDGQEAVDYLAGSEKFADRKKYPLPGLIILDLKMPRKTGMEVLEWRAAQPVIESIPTVVLSSSAHRYDIELAYRLGANAFVVKPISVAERIEVARVIKRFWLELNKPPIASLEGLEEAIKFQSVLEIPRKLL